MEFMPKAPKATSQERTSVLEERRAIQQTSQFYFFCRASSDRCHATHRVMAFKRDVEAQL